MSQTIRGYKLHDPLGGGGFGVVYRASQPILEREVAVKVIRQEFANEPTFIRSFETEAQLIARLEHPHIVPLYDFWRDPQGAYLVMRFFKGGSVRTLIQRKEPLPPAEILRLMEQIVAALHIAHQSRVVHRDIKPDNILLDENGNAYLTDFGIAKTIGQLSSHDAFSGTVAYVSPEQLLGEKPQPTMDIYSLGIMLFEMVTGHHPFADIKPLELIYHHTHVMPPEVQALHPGALAGFDTVIQRATAKDTARRYADVHDFLDELRTVVVGKSDAAKTSVQVVTTIPNPYKGLQAFQEADATDFFGRDALVASMSMRLRLKQSFLAVVGPSGSGKSSLVRAGLIPALRIETLNTDKVWFIADFQPGAKPLEALADALYKVSPVPLPNLQEQLQASEEGLFAAANTIFKHIEGYLLLIIDQFEEIFVHVESEAERAHFLNQLTYAVSQTNSPVRIVLTLRADFYDRPLLYEGFGNLIEHNTQLVLPLNQNELEQAITGPAKRVGLEVEMQLLTAMILDVRQEPGALPLLQYTLTELFEKRTGQTLTYHSYQASGGIFGALAQRAETMYLNLDSIKQNITRQLFLRLVTPNDNSEDTRRRTRRAELYETIAPRKALDEILEEFGKARLLTLTFDFEGSNREPMVEIAHEALIRGWDKLSEWIDASRNDIRLHRLLNAALNEWESQQRSPDFLLSGGRLEQFVEWMQRGDMGITPDEHAFLNASIQKRMDEVADAAARQNRELGLKQQVINRMRLFIGAVIVFGVLGLGLAIALFLAFRSASENQQRAIAAESDAVRRAEEADARLLASRLPQIAFSDPALAYGLSLALLEEMDNPPLRVRGAVTDFVLTNGVIRRFRGHGGGVSNVIYSSDGTQALSVAQDGSIILWDIASGELVQSYRIHDTWVRAVAWLPDGQRVITAAEDGTIKQWDIATSEVLLTYEGHSAGVLSISLSPDASLMVSSSADNTAIIWDVATGAIVRRLIAHENRVWSAVFAPDGQTVATASDDTHTIVWDVATGEIVYQFENTAAVATVAYCPDSQTLLTGDWSAYLTRWDLTTGEQIDRQVSHETNIWRVSCSPDGRYALTSSEDGEIILWDMELGIWLAKRKGHVLAATSVVFSPDGRTALSASEDWSVVLWDIASITERPAFIGHDFIGSDIAVAPDGRTLVSGSWDESVILWDVESQAVLHRWTEDAWVASVAYAPDGRTVLAGDWEGRLTQYDVTTGEMLQRIDAHYVKDEENRFQNVEYSPDSNRAITASIDGTVRVWDLSTGANIQTFDKHDAPVFSATFSPDGTMALSGADDGVMYLWDIATGDIVRTYRGHLGAIMDIEYAPDGQTILTASGDSRLMLWDAATGEPLRTFVGHARLVETVSFAPDGQTALSSSADTSIILWDIATGEVLRTMRGNDWMAAVDFDPDGLNAFSISGDGRIIQWQIFMPDNELISWVREHHAITEPSCADREVYHTPRRCPNGAYPQDM